MSYKNSPAEIYNKNFIHQYILSLFWSTTLH